MKRQSQFPIKTPKIYQVGGSVRDLLIGVPHHDIDYVVECSSFQEMTIFLRENNYEIFVEKPEFGCVKARKQAPKGPKGQKNKTCDFVVAKNKTCDFVLCRKDGYYSDNRRPDSIEPADLLCDLARRDFTINAIAYDETLDEYIDPHNGRSDIEHKIIRCVGNAQDRITEDPLRGIRALRFSVTKGFHIDKDIMDIVETKKFSDSLSSISKERVQVEINKMFSYNTSASLQLLADMPQHLLDAIFTRCGMKLKATFRT